MPNLKKKILLNLDLSNELIDCGVFAVRFLDLCARLD
jgi:hypothetical protein